MRWQCRLGLPPALRLGKGVVIPHWSEVRLQLQRLADSVPDFEEGAPTHAQHWRRLRVGRPHSQTEPNMGSLPTWPLLWGPVRRLATKTKPPSWYLEAVSARPYVRTLQLPPFSCTFHEGRSLTEILREAGVTMPAHIRHFARAQRMQSERIQKFLKQLEMPKSHVTSTSELGIRPICEACGLSGPMTNVFRWVALPCVGRGGFDTGPVRDSLNAKLRSATGLYRLLATLP